jgi:putative transcriptional regulator
MKQTSTSAKTTAKHYSDAPEKVEQAVEVDPDARPLTEQDFRRMRRTPQVKVIRRALEMTQQDFADRYHIPLGTLRDWEQGRTVPDQPARAYLRLIAHDPGHVNRALNAAGVYRPHHPFKG